MGKCLHQELMNINKCNMKPRNIQNLLAVLFSPLFVALLLNFSKRNEVWVGVSELELINKICLHFFKGVAKDEWFCHYNKFNNLPLGCGLYSLRAPMIQGLFIIFSSPSLSSVFNLHLSISVSIYPSCPHASNNVPGVIHTGSRYHASVRLWAITRTRGGTVREGSIKYWVGSCISSRCRRGDQRHKFTPFLKRRHVILWKKSLSIN